LLFTVEEVKKRANDRLKVLKGSGNENKFSDSGSTDRKTGQIFISLILEGSFFGNHCKKPA
jgi:hypothetical protein